MAKRDTHRRSPMQRDDLPLMAVGADGKDSRIAETVAMQLLADALERFDTTILEIRHLQVNLIYALRLAELHRALRHEESYVFGSVEIQEGNNENGSREDDVNCRKTISWSALFEDDINAPGPGSIHLLGDIFVPRMPKPLDEAIFADIDSTDGSPTQVDGLEGRPEIFMHLFDYDRFELDVHGPMRRAVRQHLMCGQWDDQFRMNYDLLLALQALKRNVVTDKLHLYWWGWRSLVSGGLPRDTSLSGKPSGEREPPQAETRRAQLYMARAGALDNLRTYVERLADYHAQFEKTLDLGSQDNHRPITGRRREQGLYHFALAEQTREHYDDASILMSRLTRPRDIRAGGSRSERTVRGIGRGSAVMVHRWQHKFTSSNLGLLDISRSRRIDKRPLEYGPSPSYSVHTVNTSFWTPDRQDFRPTIMHECAHCLLKESYADLGDLGLLRKNDLLSSLVRMMKTAVRSVESMEADIPGTENLVREVLADLIAISVSGPSYLFGVFQELFGVGIEQTLGWPAWGEVRDLSLARTTIPNGFGDQKITAEWYVRLMTLANFLEIIERDQSNPLTHVLVEGVRQACVELLSYLEGQIRIYQPSWGEEIRELTRRLSLVIRLSPMGSEVRKYRLERRASVPGQPDTVLSEAVRGRLVEALIDLKRSPGRALSYEKTSDDLRALADDAAKIVERISPWSSFPVGDFPEQGQEQNKDETFSLRNLGWDLQRFSTLCIGRNTATLKPIDDALRDRGQLQPHKLFKRAAGRLPIFETIDDVPWQCSLIRSMELTWNHVGTGARQVGCLAEELGEDFAPGRTMHQVALEFWTYDRKRPHDRLSEAIRLVRELIGEPTTVRFEYTQFDDGTQILVDRVEEALGVTGKGVKEALVSWLGRGIEATQIEAVLMSHVGKAVSEVRTEHSSLSEQRKFDVFCERALEAFRKALPACFELLSILSETVDASRRHQLRSEIGSHLRGWRLVDRVKGHKNNYLRLAERIEVSKFPALGILKLHTSYPFQPSDYRLEKAFDLIQRSTDSYAIDERTFLQKLGEENFWRQLLYQTLDKPDFTIELEGNAFDVALETLLTSITCVADELVTLLAEAAALTENDLIETAADAPRSRRFWADAKSGNEEPVGLQPTLAALAINKIEELAEILDQPLPGDSGDVKLSDHPAVLPLRSLCRLQSHAKRGSGDDPTVELALNSLSRPKSPRRIQPVLVSRTSFINSQFWRERVGHSNPAGERFVPLATKSDGKNGRAGDNFGIRQFAVLGRYDYITLSVDDPIFVNRLPFLDTQKEGRSLSNPNKPFSSLSNEKMFREFFERRDQALMFRISDDPIQPISERMVFHGSDDAADILGFMSLRTDRRSTRLELLERLRRARAWWDQARFLPIESFSETLSELSVEELSPTQSTAVGRKGNPFLRPAFRKQFHKELVESLGSESLPELTSINDLVEHVRLHGKEIPKLPIEASGAFFKRGDLALLGEGWPDIVLAFATERSTYDDPADKEPARRLFDIFVLQQCLFQDFAIYRTEMFLRPLALVGARRDGGRFAFTQVIRCREDRQLSASMTRLNETINKELDKAEAVIGSDEAFSVYQVPGRNDLEMVISNISAMEDYWEENADAASLLDSLHNLAGARSELGGGAFEEIITRVSFNARNRVRT